MQVFEHSLKLNNAIIHAYLLTYLLTYLLLTPYKIFLYKNRRRFPVYSGKRLFV